MQYRFLGRSGLQVSAFSFGSWVTFGNQMQDETALEAMQTALDGGINFFDNAEAYARGESETIMGRVIRKAGWNRSDLVLSTKIYWGGEGPNQRGLSRKHLIEGTDAALARLQVDYVDLLFAHRPDPQTPMEEIVRAMSFLVNTGRAFYWGTSEWSAEQIRHAHELARREHLVPPTMEQPQYHMFHRDRVEKEYAPLYEDLGLGTTIWSPLASGLLTGKYNDGIPEGSRLSLDTYAFLRDIVESDEGRERIQKVKQLAPVAAALETNTTGLALAWCLLNPNVSTVILGASNPDQLRENLKAMDLVERFTPAVLEQIESILENKPEPERNWRE